MPSRGGVGVVCGRRAAGLETMPYKELTEQVSLDVRELGAFPLGKDHLGEGEALWGDGEGTVLEKRWWLRQGSSF